jgi:hypothetical protein
MSSFIDQTNDRRLPADYRGPVLVWDIDKTYLDTHFSTWRGLMRIPFEWAVDKVALPGAVPLLRSLRRGADAQSVLTPLYFISGSPKSMRRVVESKMQLDGVDFDGLTFKDQWGLLKAGRPADLLRQHGYKLQALLRYDHSLPVGSRYLLFGDDVEADEFIFQLFGRVVSGLRGLELEGLLRGLSVPRPDVKAILRLTESMPVRSDPVEGIFILQHRSRHPDPGPAVVRAPTFAPIAASLVERGLISPDGLRGVVKDLRQRGVSAAMLADAAEQAYAVGGEAARELVRQSAGV